MHVYSNDCSLIILFLSIREEISKNKHMYASSVYCTSHKMLLSSSFGSCCFTCKFGLHRCRSWTHNRYRLHMCLLQILHNLHRQNHIPQRHNLDSQERRIRHLQSTGAKRDHSQGSHKLGGSRNSTSRLQCQATPGTARQEKTRV